MISALELSVGGAHGPPFALDREARLADLAAAGLAKGEADAWTREVMLPTERLVELYATFSPIHALPEARRRALLGGLAEIAEHEFGGEVERTFTTALYMARKP